MCMGRGCRLSYVFFFSSRRRHTRSKRDWSSDVCSSDLGDVLTNAQGEDVVSGARTPESISTLKRGKLAKVYRELQRIATKLERHFRDVQDIEFTFEHGKLYLLQTRRAQRAGLAAVRTAVEMVEEGLITPGEAVQRVPPQDLDQLFHPMVDPRASVTLVAKGLPASPGRRRARRCSTRTRRRPWPMRAAKSSSSGQRPPPRIFTGSWRRRLCSPRAAA